MTAAAAKREISGIYLVLKAIEGYLDRLISAGELKLTRD